MRPLSAGRRAPGRSRGRRSPARAIRPSGASPQRRAGARLPRRPCSGGFHVDSLRTLLVRLGHAYRQHAVVKVRVDALLVGMPRQRHAILELPAATCPPAQDALAFLLLDLAGDQQFVVPQLDVYVLAADAWKLGFDDP